MSLPSWSVVSVTPIEKLTDPDAIIELVGSTWTVRDGAIEKSLRFADFPAALAFVNRVGAVAEELDHHPDITLRWDTVTLSCRTHFVSAITDADIVLCKRIDQLDAGSESRPT